MLWYRVQKRRDGYESGAFSRVTKREGTIRRDETWCKLLSVLWGICLPLSYYLEHGWLVSWGGACTTTPAAVSCVVSVPAVIEHKSVSTGVIRSSARGVANVGCTGKASVGLSSPGGIALYNGKEHVDSRLSVQRGGSTAVIVVADPSVDVDLLSDIDTTQPRAGVYSGAGVLVASWD